jgi:peptidyl-dipeptidase A
MFEDKLLARQLRIIRLDSERNQLDQHTIGQITEINRKLNEKFINFRSEVDGERLSEKGVKRILVEEMDLDRRKKAWEASKQIGQEVAPAVRELARLRNGSARKAGYRNYHAMALTLREIDEAALFNLLDELYELTNETFGATKSDLDGRLAKRFGIEPDQLAPWHYADPFFQEAPQIHGIEFDQLLSGKDLEDLARRTFSELGMDVGDILDRSDLYERENKYQHAFACDMDREGDIRIICNLIQDLGSINTLHHELGHAVFEEYMDRTLPWLLRGPNHAITTEAMAILAGRFSSSREWLSSILELSAKEVREILPEIQAHERLSQLILARWMIVVIQFERALYSDPEQDLDERWWDLVEKYQLVRRPPGRKAPDWASKIHISLYPAYYQNYLLGSLMSYQWQQHLMNRFDTVVGNPEAGRWLIEKIFQRGKREDWNAALELATGEKLSAEAFGEQI